MDSSSRNNGIFPGNRTRRVVRCKSVSLSDVIQVMREYRTLMIFQLFWFSQRLQLYVYKSNLMKRVNVRVMRDIRRFFAYRPFFFFPFKKNKIYTCDKTYLIFEWFLLVRFLLSSEVNKKGISDNSFDKGDLLYIDSGRSVKRGRRRVPFASLDQDRITHLTLKLRRLVHR